MKCWSFFSTDFYSYVMFYKYLIAIKCFEWVSSRHIDSLQYYARRGCVNPGLRHLPQRAPFLLHSRGSAASAPTPPLCSHSCSSAIHFLCNLSSANTLDVWLNTFMQEKRGRYLKYIIGNFILGSLTSLSKTVSFTFFSQGVGAPKSHFQNKLFLRSYS